MKDGWSVGMDEHTMPVTFVVGVPPMWGRASIRRTLLPREPSCSAQTLTANPAPTIAKSYFLFWPA